MFSVVQNSLFLVLVTILPVLVRIFTATDDQKITDLTLCLVSCFVIFFLIKVPWDLFQARCAAHKGQRSFEGPTEAGLSALNVLLFMVNILCPFVCVAIIKHLKHQYAMESSILNWINLELVVCVTLLRPFVFLANKLGSTTFDDESLSKSSIHLYHSSSEANLDVAHLLERIEQLEERIQNLEERTADARKQSASTETSPLHSPTVDRYQKPEKKSLLHVLICWYFSILAFLFHLFVPFSSRIAKLFNKPKSD